MRKRVKYVGLSVADQELTVQ